MKRRIDSSGAMLALLVGLMAMVALSRPVWADNPEVCVSNDLGFAAAAVNAEFSPLTIKFVQGTYHVNGTAFDNSSASFQGFSLLGGYTDATCASRQIDPNNTILNVGTGAYFYADVIGDVTIEGIRFSGPNAGFDLNWGDYYHDIPASVHLTVRRNIVSGGNGDTSSGSLVQWIVGGSQAFSARVVDNLIHDNSGAYGCALDLAAVEGSDATFDVINNTIVDNAVGDGGVCAGYYGNNEGVVRAYNNILYGNAGYDVASHTTLVLVDNVIGTHYAYPVGTIPIGTLTGDPQLNASFHPIEVPASPVINSGSNSVPGGLPAHDLDGGPRVVGTTVDRGAYESSINDAFIQPVTNTNDTGVGSLRAAIASVNANGSGLITFGIGSSCGPQVITLASELPALTKGAIINGYTQTGTSANDLDTGDDATLCVILESGNSNVTHGLQVASGAGDAVAVSIKGFGFSGFSDAAIDLQGGSGHFVAGNHFGGSIGGHALQPNGIDIRLGISAHDATIGSDDNADRNIVGDATGSGIVLQGGASPPLVLGTYNNQILNNYIGLGWSVGGGNYTNRGNGTRGIHLLGHDNTLSGNLIGDNTQAGILIDGGGALSNLIDGNFIGADAGGAVLGNGNAGIHFTGASGDAPSGNTIRYNTIANNGDEGVLVSIGQGNKIRRNRIYNNALLGIDLAAEGVTPNDDDGGIQLNDYANRGQNFPVLTGAAGGYHSGRVSGSLTTTGGDYTVDLYASPSCDASGYGEGKTWLKSGTVTVTVPQGLHQGTATFTIPFTTTPLLPLFGGDAITATATDAAGDTSEFSACMPYLNDTIFADGFEPFSF
jgi:parallel beta-helix repeat protein